MIRLSLAAPFALLLASPALATEVRTCGSLHTAPLSDEREVQSGLLQAFAVVNTGGQPVTLTGMRFELGANGQVTDTRVLQPDQIAAAVRQGPSIEALGQVIPSQLCNEALLKGAKMAKSATLAPGEALVFVYQPFVWQGHRDRLEIIATTTGGEEARAQIAIDSRTSQTQALFPVTGRNFVAVAASFHTPHRWAVVEQFALDILALGADNSSHQGDGSHLSDYFAYGRPVRTVADGTVVEASGDTPDNAAMLKRPGESDEAYFKRLLEAQNELLVAGIGAVMGNHVVIDHGNGEYSVYAHLKQGSLRVKAGQRLKAGETIAALGSSGNSTEPHLHFQICDSPDMAKCQSLPTSFRGVVLPFELAPRTIQSGDVVETSQ